MIIRKRGWDISKIVLIISILFLSGLFMKAVPSYTVNGVYYHYNLTDEMISMPIDAETEMIQRFVCRGNGLSSIVVFFDECQKESGFVTVSMEDADENIIISPIEFDLGAYHLDSLAIPLDCNSVLKCKEEYIIRFSFADIDAENPPCIKTYDSGGLGETLYINNAKVSDKIAIAYNYEDYYQIEQFIELLLTVIAALIPIVAMSFFEIQLKGKADVIGREVLVIVLAVGNGLLFDCLNDGLAHLSIGHLLKNVVPIYIVCRVTCFLVRTVWGMELIVGTVSFLASLANYFVVLFRGRPIGPWDIAAISTAATVANEYKYEITAEIVLAFILLMSLWQIGFRLKTEKKVFNGKSAAVEALVVGLSITVYGLAIYL